MELSKHPKIAVVGSGALGGYVGARLAHSGLDVSFLLRSDYAAVAERGWLIRSIGESDIVVDPVQAFKKTSEIGRVDCVLIGLKTTQNDKLDALLRPLLGPGTVIVPLQNGLGVAEALARRFPRHPVIAGICHVAANRVAPGVITNQVPRGGRVRLAPVAEEDSGMASQLCAWMRAAGLQSDVAPDLAEAVWRKLMWNVPFNGLPVALNGASTGDVLNDDALTSVAKALMEELRAAANTLGANIPEEFTEQMIETTRHLGAYQASTVVDFIEGRSLEVESIWGEPLRQGQSAGVAMPHLATLYAILRGLNRRRSE